MLNNQFPKGSLVPAFSLRPAGAKPHMVYPSHAVTISFGLIDEDA